MKKLLKYASYGLLLYFLTCVITPFNKALRNRSINNQIEYLDQILRKGYDDQLQNRFPEGKLFSNALFSLSILKYCEDNRTHDLKYSKIIDLNIERILSEQAKSHFNVNMNPSHGMFYTGWTNYVLKEYMNNPLFQFSKSKKEIKDYSKILETEILNIQRDSLQILDSYLEANWPADNLVGIASLNEKTVQKEWLELLLKTTEHPSELIHHSGSQPYEIRGSSQALMTFCLSEIRDEKVKSYNEHFKKIFVDEYLGVQLVKENEDGSNEMDYDSGPVVLGYGASATIMNIKTQASLGDGKSKRTWSLMNCISLPINLFGKKYYLFQQEPMFDIFMLWASVELA